MSEDDTASVRCIKRSLSVIESERGSERGVRVRVRKFESYCESWRER